MAVQHNGHYQTLYGAQNPGRPLARPGPAGRHPGLACRGPELQGSRGIKVSAWVVDKQHYKPLWPPSLNPTDIPSMTLQTPLVAVFAGLLSACFVIPDPSPTQASGETATAPTEVQIWQSVQPDLEISRAPFREVHANWKQRLDQPYIYIEYTGSYTETGRLLPMLHQAMADQGLEASGPPFALFYDDPGRVATARLRSRACVPVAQRENPSGELTFDILPSCTVVYAYAAGAYPDVPRILPGLYRYMGSLGWSETGPVREVYLIPPSRVASYDDLHCEVQIPVGPGN
jgi:effector-binding domain-containing protein